MTGTAEWVLRLKPGAVAQRRPVVRLKPESERPQHIPCLICGERFLPDSRSHRTCPTCGWKHRHGANFRTAGESSAGVMTWPERAAYYDARLLLGVIEAELDEVTKHGR